MWFCVECTCRRWRSLSEDGGRWYSLDTTVEGLPDVRALRSRISNMKRASVTALELQTLSSLCRGIERLELCKTRMTEAMYKKRLADPSPEQLLEALKQQRCLTAIDFGDVAAPSSFQGLLGLQQAWTEHRCPPLPDTLTALHIRSFESHKGVKDLMLELAKLRKLCSLSLIDSSDWKTGQVRFVGLDGKVQDPESAEAVLSQLDKLPCVRSGKLQRLRLFQLRFANRGQPVEDNAWPNLRNVPHLDLSVGGEFRKASLPLNLASELPKVRVIELQHHEPHDFNFPHAARYGKSEIDLLGQTAPSLCHGHRDQCSRLTASCWPAKRSPCRR